MWNLISAFGILTSANFAEWYAAEVASAACSEKFYSETAVVSTDCRSAKIKVLSK